LSRADLYVSADVETDGPLPGVNSMLSMGFAVAGVFSQGRFEAADPEAQTFYRELRPAFDAVVPEALAVTGLDRDALAREGADPADAMTEAAAWVREVAGECRPVLVAYPLSFDWLFLQWHFLRFGRDGSPFGHSSCLDAKTILQVKTGEVLDEVRRDRLPEAVRPTRPHLHHALGDAIEQAELLARLLAWEGPGGD